jgi:hypothetical protein
MPPIQFYGRAYVGSGGKENVTCEEHTESVPPSRNANLVVAKVLWRDKPEKWKWAYGKVEVEALRTQTHESEIVEAYWKFTVLPPPRSKANGSTQTASQTIIIPSLKPIIPSSNPTYSPNH